MRVLQVPPVVRETVATLHVSVTGEKDSMSKKAKILIRPSTFITLVQTDKPIYKPGQKGRRLALGLHTV